MGYTIARPRPIKETKDSTPPEWPLDRVTLIPGFFTITSGLCPFCHSTVIRKYWKFKRYCTNEQCYYSNEPIV
jgi:hypothetical protein